jgi:hypothetical protein
VEITEEQGMLKGRILKSCDPLKTNPTCGLCEGEWEGQPVFGMVFLWGLTRQGEEFKGGFILDPDNGKVYKVKVRVDEGGKSSWFAPSAGSRSSATPRPGCAKIELEGMK